MSIYATVKDRLPEERRSPDPRQAGIIVVDNLGGDPLVGITYRADHRAEEESGTGDLRRAFHERAHPSAFIPVEEAKSSEVVAKIKERPVQRRSNPDSVQADLLFLSEEMVGFRVRQFNFSHEYDLGEAKRALSDGEAYANGVSVPSSCEPRAVLVEKAKALGIPIKNRNRADLSAEIYRVMMEAAPESTVHPGWFRSGTILVLPRTKDTFGAVLEGLIEAAQAGFLTFGLGGFGPFGSGLSMFDERDLSEASRQNIIEQGQQYRERMEALVPYAGLVRHRLGGFFFLGNPRTNADGEVTYWLNGHTTTLSNGQRAQPFGWYTLKDLELGKYLADAESKAKAG